MLVNSAKALQGWLVWASKYFYLSEVIVAQVQDLQLLQVGNGRADGFYLTPLQPQPRQLCHVAQRLMHLQKKS